MKKRTFYGTGPVLMELLLSIIIFSLAATFCISVFVHAKSTSDDSAELTQAVLMSRSAAECFKATGGDLENTAAILGGEAYEDSITVFYNNKRQPTAQKGSAFTLWGKKTTEKGISTLDISVTDGGGIEIYALSVSVCEGVSR